MANPVVHFEIGGRDSAKINRFYSQLFGWKIEQHGSAGTIASGRIRRVTRKANGDGPTQCQPLDPTIFGTNRCKRSSAGGRSLYSSELRESSI